MNNDDYLPVKDQSIYTDAMIRAITNVPQELREKSERALKKMISPTMKLYEVKQNLWSELHAASNQNRKIIMNNIFKGVFSREYFFNSVLKSPQKMAWLIHPLTTYENRITAALQMATERYEELIGMDITTLKRRKSLESGEWEEYREVDAKKAAVLLSAIKQLEDRKLGVSVQRQININKDEKTPKETVVDNGKIDERIKEIEDRLGSMNDEVIDV